MSADADTARHWLGRALSAGDERTAQRVLSLLPDLEAQAAAELIPLVTRLLAESQESQTLRSAAALALAKFNPELADAAVWNALQAARQAQNGDALKAAATWALCELGRFGEMGLVRAPAGEFWMGSDKSKDRQASDDECPQHSVYLPTFYIARYPVTGSEWRAYCQASGHQPKDSNSLKAVGEHPVGYVTWHEALAYAQWHGFALPSEAEWEKSARGTDGRIYPWGDEWRPGRANTEEFWKASIGGKMKRLFRRSVYGRTTPVGQFSPLGDSPYGCADLSGNVWEWTRSHFKSYPYDPAHGREDLRAGDEIPRVLRGGSFIHESRRARCSCRDRLLPKYLLEGYGFRVGAGVPSSSEL